MYTFICLQRFVFFYMEGFNFLCEDSTVVCLLMFSLPLTSSASMSHTETQAKSAIVQKLHRVIKCKRWCLHDVHCAIIDIWVNERDREDNGAPWVSKDRAGVCYFCLPVGLHVCDKRERPLPMFAQCVLSKCAPCFCAVCVHVCVCLSAIKQCGLPV